MDPYSSDWNRRRSSEVNTIQMPRGAARNTEPTDTASELTMVPPPLWFLGWLAFPVPLRCICPTTNSRVDSRCKLCQAPTHLFTTKPTMTTKISGHQMVTENLVERSSFCRLRVSFLCRLLAHQIRVSIRTNPPKCRENLLG